MWIRDVRRVLASVAFGWAFFAVTGATLATTSTPCWGPVNTGVRIGYTDSSFGGTTSAVGVRSNVDLYAESPYSGTSIIHPIQIENVDPNVSNEAFVGFGTYRGFGSTVGTTYNCDTDYATHWRIYIDGRNADTNQYFCKSLYGSLPLSAVNQSFLIQLVTCGSSTGWGFYLNGAYLTCISWGLPSRVPYHGAIQVGSESHNATPPGDYNNLRVTEANINVKVGSTWYPLNSAAYWGTSDKLVCANAPHSFSPSNGDYVDLRVLN